MQKITKAIVCICIVLAVALLALSVAYFQKQNEDAQQTEGKQQSFFDFVGQAFKVPKQPIKLAINQKALKKNEFQIRKSVADNYLNSITCQIARSTGTWVDIGSNAKQREDDSSKATAATTKIGKFTACYDADGNDLKKAAGVYYFDYLSGPTYVGYSYKQAPLSACKILPDKCKADGLPFIYEAYCDQKNTAKYKAAADDCRKIFGNNKYICLQGKCVLKQEKKEESNEEENDKEGTNTSDTPQQSEEQQQPEQPTATEEPKQKPDLVVDTIYPTIYGKQCVNSYYFKICNNGDAIVEKPFAIQVTANDFSSEFTYFPAEFSVLKPAECVDVVKPEKLTILKFSVALQSTNDVTVVLDTTNEIAEKDEANNQKMMQVYSGDGYIYDPANPTEVCDTYCYDSDDSKNYGKEGAVLFKYKGYISTEQDYCWGKNEVKTQLAEMYCKTIVKYENTGKFSNPLGKKWFDCTLLNTEEQQYKCEQNKCVPCEGGKCWYATNGTEPGKEEICKEITTQTDEGSEPSINEPDADPFVKGNNDICTDSNSLQDGDEPPLDPDSLPSDTVKAYCADTGEEVGSLGGGSPEELSDFEEFLKDLLGDYVPDEPTNYDCSSFSTANQAYACVDGKCVVVDVDKESCQGPTINQIDAYKPDKIIYTTVQGDKTKEELDWCGDYGDTVVQVYCKGKKWSSKEYSCVKDGAACIYAQDGSGGRCVYPDESKKKCTEQDDLGIDYEHYGWIAYTTEYDQSDTKNDYCINDDQLIEYYCEGKENKFTEPFSCKTLGKKCVGGVCM